MSGSVAPDKPAAMDQGNSATLRSTEWRRIAAHRTGSLGLWSRRPRVRVPSLTASARYVADHVPNARIQELPDAGHAAPLTDPEALAEALTEFFSRAQQTA